MGQDHPCPKCGKPMIEQPKWEGLWTCPDYQKPIGKRGKVFVYKCTGMKILKKGVQAFDREVEKLIAESN